MGSRQQTMSTSFPKSLKNQSSSLSCARHFTRLQQSAFDLIHFPDQDLADNEISPQLVCPENWNPLATEVLAEQAACSSIPAEIVPVEENTVPSWLWSHRARGKKTTAEHDVRQIFGRVVGSAVAFAWKKGFFSDESNARNFYDEACYALTQRFIAIEPKLLASLGLNWAYGLQSPDASDSNPPAKMLSNLSLSNSAIDKMVAGDTEETKKLSKFLNGKNNNPTTITFSDISANWGATESAPTSAMIDVMTVRHNDGSLNINKLRHAVRLLVIMHDFHNLPLSLGFANLANLLMALALPYDSESARNFAAAISALVTAEAFATSAELAALRGISPDFQTHRDDILRNLRNHRRAAYGDRNDFEKLSVIPVAINVKKSPDLALVAAAERRWDEALEKAREHGLRHVSVSSLAPSAELSLFLETGRQSLAPLRNLRTAPVVFEALTRLNYDRHACNLIAQYVVGHKTLQKAPQIHHMSLKAVGFDDEALEAIENYLLNVNDIKLGFTPWVIGYDFCRKVLKISAQKLDNPAFHMLRHFGFSDDALHAANNYYYGHGHIMGCPSIKPSDVGIFATEKDVSGDAQIRMAASVQSHISGAVKLSVPRDASTEQNEKLLLTAWRLGLHALTLAPHVVQAAPNTMKERKSVSAFLHTQTRPALPTKHVRAKASSRMVTMKTPTAPHKESSKDSNK